MKRKVIIIGSAHPLRGGLADYNERLALALMDKGHDVKIYTFSLQYPSFLFPGKTQYSEQPSPKDLDIKIRVNSINPLNWIKTGWEIRKGRPDFVIMKFWLPFMGPCFGTIARIFKKNKHTKLIAILDNVIPHEKRIGDRPLTSYFIKACDAFISMSRSVLKDLRQFTPTSYVRFIPHPIYDIYGERLSKEKARKSLGLNTTGKYLLFFGFIRKYKGLDLLLEALKDERIKERKINLIIAGEFYEDRKYYDDLIKQYRLKELVIDKSQYIPNTEVNKYFGAADIIVQPYRSATQSGISQMSYHFEKPMIVTNVGGLPEMVPNGKAGYVVSPEPKEIADALIDFYDNQKESEFIKNVKEEKKKYSWENMVKAIEELYEEVKEKRK